MTEEKVPGPEKKILIDEDWKSQVQAEKQRVEERKPEPRGPLPPADISLLFSMLGSQALVDLGALPSPVTQKPEVNVAQAKHFIDLLGVLEEKTRNNLTPDEKQHLDGLLYQLRMLYVQTQSKD